MNRILVTGGSGFIGTNLVESFRQSAWDVLNLDIRPPRHPIQQDTYRAVDILDRSALRSAFEQFAPTLVVHLAARTDLDDSAGLEGYRVNTDGVRNVVDAVARQPSVLRAVFASTKLVCPTDYRVQHLDDYRPDTVYGQSKVIGEQIVKRSALDCDWCLVRPTSIWGPWCETPYGRFFRMIGRGRYFHPGRFDPPRTFGYVGNVVFQLKTILAAARDQIHRRVLYLSDYHPFTIRQWADTISQRMCRRRVRTIPEPLVRLLAWVGDLAKLCGVKEPPLSSFRLRNMRADTTGIPVQPTRELTGPLPYTMEQGVEATIEWLNEYGGTESCGPSSARHAPATMIRSEAQAKRAA